MIGVDSNAGFMSKDVEGVTLAMKLLLEVPSKMADVDSEVVPVPWNQELYDTKKKLKIGW